MAPESGSFYLQDVVPVNTCKVRVIQIQITIYYYGCVNGMNCIDMKINITINNACLYSMKDITLPKGFTFCIIINNCRILYI